MKQVTSFYIDWYDCGLCCALDAVHQRTSIYLRKNLIKIERFNGLGELLTKEEFFVFSDSINEFFDFINKMDLNNEWKNDYSVMVCDGSIWEMRLRYNDKTIRLIKGTVEKPNKGRKIEKMIKDMITAEKCLEMPVLFGC